MFRTIQRQLKSILDFGVSLIALAVLLPLFAIVAVAIKIDDGGPVFFRQQRLGGGAKPFSIWKFRSMVVDADEQLLCNDGMPSGNRITRVGSIIRRLSIDELPQLINVVRGEVSFVGPRAVLPSHWQRYDDFQRRRFEVRPGITGLAQVNGRNTLPWTRRLELDVQYVDHFSLVLDLLIILKTFYVVIRGDGFVADRNPLDVDDLPKSASQQASE
ncbi:putative sugar transferase EpsL [Rosistilla ulvae]|uniref:Putative sugar transferase EpsL n=1 Tax=Rosistilla ulvae TaxID=1930277 RepID=A0A517LX84_9BACT|nr:sugar transferase [Rosistilla ulvae]QDS87235.1 putative sugar transferase EpsL [Rosistilla ulvae]